MVSLMEYAWKDAAKCDPRGSLLQYMGAITKKSCQSTLRLSTISILHNASKGDDKVIVAQCSCPRLTHQLFFNICIYNTEQMTCKQFAQSLN